MLLDTSVTTFKRRKESIRKSNTGCSSFETVSLDSINNENEFTLEEGDELNNSSINMKFKKYHELVMQTEQLKIKQLMEDIEEKSKEMELLKHKNEVLRDELKKERRLWRIMMLEVFQKKNKSK